MPLRCHCALVHVKDAGIGTYSSWMSQGYKQRRITISDQCGGETLPDLSYACSDELKKAGVYQTICHTLIHVELGHCAG